MIDPTEALRLAGQMAARYRFLTREDQEDVAVDAVMRLMKNHDGVRAWRAYLAVCVRSIALDVGRKARKSPVVVADLADVEHRAGGGNEFAETDARLSLGAIVPPEFEPMAAMLIDGYNCHEIGEAMGLTPVTVRVRTMRMRNEIGGRPAWLN